MVRAWEGFHYKPNWKALQQRGMRQNFSWHESAKEYVKMYNSIFGIVEEVSFVNHSG
jgi:starch synthase